MQRKIWYSILGLDAMPLSLKNLLLNNLCLGCYARLFGTAGYRGTQSNVWTDESEEFKTSSIKIKGKTPISGIPAVIGVTSEACIRCNDSVSIL